MKLFYITPWNGFTWKPKIKEFQYGGSLHKVLFLGHFIFGRAETGAMYKNGFCIPSKNSVPYLYS